MRPLNITRDGSSIRAGVGRCLLALLPLIAACSGQPNGGSVVVIDAATRSPIEAAVVTSAGQVQRTDAKGMAYLRAPARHVLVRAAGYARTELEVREPSPATVVARLAREVPKALYLSVYGVGDKRLRTDAFRLLRETELNAVVIDVKGDRGLVPYGSGVALAHAVGAQRVITLRDMAGLLGSLHAQGIYTVARVVTFKDDKLARARPQWAARVANGQVWLDREGLAWTDPFRKEVWAYNIDIAEEVARMGFDEIQFDYVRFPDEPGPVFSQPPTQRNRVAAVTGFLAAANKRLEPYNVFVAADVFGYTLWNLDDTRIGQRLEDMAPQLDYISPMLYPSAFQFGIPGYSNPVAHPYEVVSQSLRNARMRTRLAGVHFRPWLQAFRDYAFDRRVFGAKQIEEQIRAAEEFGSDGWMLWNPRNVYGAAGLRKKQDAEPRRCERACAENWPRRADPGTGPRAADNKKPA